MFFLIHHLHFTHKTASDTLNFQTITGVFASQVPEMGSRFLYLDEKSGNSLLRCADKKRHPRKDVSVNVWYEIPRLTTFARNDSVRNTYPNYLLSAVATSTAQATVQPTIGLLPIPRNPIISTCAGTDEEPANCASEPYNSRGSETK